MAKPVPAWIKLGIASAIAGLAYAISVGNHFIFSHWYVSTAARIPLCAALAAIFGAPIYILSRDVILPGFNGFSRRAKVLWVVMAIGAGGYLLLVLPNQVPTPKTAPPSSATDPGSSLVQASPGSWMDAEAGRIMSSVSGSQALQAEVAPVYERLLSASRRFLLNDSQTIASGLQNIKGDAAQSVFTRRLWRLVSYLADTISLAFLFLLVSAYYASRPLHTQSVQAKGSDRTFDWALAGYALPCIIVWTIYLLSFWPGLMSADSIFQWSQILNGRFYNSFPAFHTLTYWLITRIWLSPAALALAQILAMAFFFALTMKEMAAWGVPLWARIAMTAVFALSLVNSTMVLAIWKDIAYTIAFLALWVVILKIVRTHGLWLKNTWHMVAFGAALVTVTLYRLNGPFLALLVAASVWLMVSGGIRKAVLYAAAGALVVIALISGPLFWAIKVVPSPPWFTFQVVSHQLGAFVAADTPLTAEERNLLSSIQPLDTWRAKYNCYTLNPLVYNPEFNTQYFDGHWKEILSVWLQLAGRNPQLLLRHQLCVTSMIWRVTAQPDSYITTIAFDMYPNSYGLALSSAFPAFSSEVNKFLYWTNEPAQVWYFWRPALYLYLTLAAVTLLALRLRSKQVMLLSVPSLANSLILMALITVQDFRFQYPVYVIGLLSLPLLLIKRSPFEENESLAPTGDVLSSARTS